MIQATAKMANKARLPTSSISLYIRCKRRSMGMLWTNIHGGREFHNDTFLQVLKAIFLKPVSEHPCGYRTDA